MSTIKKDSKLKAAYTLHGHTLDNVDSTRYIGVNSQSDFKWDGHIDSICSRANKKLRF